MHLSWVHAVARAGLPALTRAGLKELAETLPNEASLAQLTEALSLFESIRSGHFATLPVASDFPSRFTPGEIRPFEIPEDLDDASLLDAAIRAVPGLRGSANPEDATALADLVSILRQRDRGADARLRGALVEILHEGSPLMEGASLGCLHALDDDAERFPELPSRLGSWLDAATHVEARRALSLRLRGLLLASATRVESAPALVEALADRIDAMEDPDFLPRLPALRGAFNVLSPAARARFMTLVAERLDIDGHAFALPTDPATLAMHARADAAGRDALRGLR